MAQMRYETENTNGSGGSNRSSNDNRTVAHEIVENIERSERNFADSSESSRSVSGSSSDRSVTGGSYRNVSHVGADSSESRRGDWSEPNDNWFQSLIRKWFDYVNTGYDDSTGKGYWRQIWPFLSLFGLGSGISALTGLGATSAVRGLGDVSRSTSQSNSSSDTSFWSWFKNLFSGSGSGSSGLGAGLLGLGEDYASSILNYNNQVKLIDKQNEYNTPASQMQRFADAGLNPNLIYGMGSNGNQPSSGSVAPVDFATASRENRMAMLNYKMELGLKEANINLLNAQAGESNERKQFQALQNSVYLQGWFNDQIVKAQSLSLEIQKVHNDSVRVGLEKDLKDAEVILKRFQSQPEYMKKLGSVEDAMSFIDGLLQRLSERIKNYSTSYTDSDGVSFQSSGDGWRGVGSSF